SQGAVRLRQPQRHQMEMRVQCPDDLVAADHPVRIVAAVVERLDIQKFSEPIRAREGMVGRDATDPGLVIGWWVYGWRRGRGAGGASFRREERLQKLLEESRQHVQALREQLDAPETLDKVKAKQVAMQKRRAEEKQKRLEQAMAQLPELKQRQEEAAKRAGKG